MKDHQLLLECQRFQVVRRTYRTSNGHTVTREIVEHPGAVVILPLLSTGEVCLIRNFRVGIDQALIELPAGTLERGEEPRETARRELIEETGYVAGRIDPLPGFWMSPGILTERMHAFVAHDIQPGESAREIGEEIENQVVTWSVALAMIERGEIQDAKSIATLLMYDRFHKG
jgi:ADP-ribose pyrophosphatase